MLSFSTELVLLDGEPFPLLLCCHSAAAFPWAVPIPPFHRRFRSRLFVGGSDPAFSLAVPIPPFRTRFRSRLFAGGSDPVFSYSKRKENFTLFPDACQLTDFSDVVSRASDDGSVLLVLTSQLVAITVCTQFCLCTHTIALSALLHKIHSVESFIRWTTRTTTTTKVHSSQDLQNLAG